MTFRMLAMHLFGRYICGPHLYSHSWQPVAKLLQEGKYVFFKHGCPSGREIDQKTHFLSIPPPHYQVS